MALRLAQCLHPNLPSGVHQKTLEVYSTVFSILNNELHSQISIWIPGLLPLMAYASINVKPKLIELFEENILILPSLRNILKSLLISFLPGIDDESSESFNAVFQLIDNIKQRVMDDSHFWQCFFLVVISCPDKRPGALIWANKRLPKFQSLENTAKTGLLEEAQMAISPDPGLMIRAFCKGLQDDHALVQRGFLDLLLKNLELQSPALALSDSRDLQLLLISACSTVLRRDMSLNRRLWTWFLGPEPGNSASTPSKRYTRSEYFKKFASEPLVKELLQMINSKSKVPTDQVKAFKICLSILDRWEIGGSVVSKVLIPILKSVQWYNITYSKQEPQQYDEIVKSAGALFDGVEAINIWHDVLELVLDQDFELLLFVLDTFNVQDEVMIVTHLPLIFLVLLFQPNKSILWSTACFAVLELIPDRAFLPLDYGEDEIDSGSVLKEIKLFYQQNTDDIGSISAPLDATTLTHYILSTLSSLATKSIVESDVQTTSFIFDLLANLLEKIHNQVNCWRDEKLISALCKNLTITTLDASYYTTLTGLSKLFTMICSGLNSSELNLILAKLLTMLWTSLCSDESEFYQVEIVRSIWTLQEKLNDKKVESVLANLFVESLIPLKAKAFNVLWYHSVDRTNYEDLLNRCTFLMIDLQGSTYVDHWLESVVSNGSANALFSLLVEPIINTNFLNQNKDELEESTDDVEMFIYYVTTLFKVLNANAGLKHTYFREAFPDFQGDADNSSFAVLITHYLVRVFKMKPLLGNCQYIKACAELMQFTIQDNQVERVCRQLNLVELLIEYLKKIYREDSKSIAQVHVISLLSKCVTSPAIPVSSTITTYMVRCLIDGLSKSTTSEMAVEAWIGLLVDCLPVFDDSIIQLLIPLVECLCVLATKSFKTIKGSFNEERQVTDGMNGSSQLFIFYMNGLDKLLVNVHSRQQDDDSRKNSIAKPPNSPEPGFFGNVISGVFSVESPLARSAAANNRLTVLLCFQDVIKVCLQVWLWVDGRINMMLQSSLSSSDSLAFVTSRIKSRTRKLLGRLYGLETLETLTGIIDFNKITITRSNVFKLIHVLDGSRPKMTVPYLFQAVINNRNSPSTASNMSMAISGDEKQISSSASSTATDLTDEELTTFLVQYVESLENDAIEEIWYECISFLKDVSTNAVYARPHLVPDMLKLIGVIAEKLEFVKFGEQRKIRKDLGDIFLKLLNFAFSTKPTLSSTASPLSELASANSSTTYLEDSVEFSASTGLRRSEELSRALQQVVTSSLRAILIDNDRIYSSLSSITSHLIAPAVKSKQFPNSFTPYLLDSLQAVMMFSSGAGSSTITATPSGNNDVQRSPWKQTVGDAFFDQRFISLLSVQQAILWKPVISRWAQFDKDRIKDYLTRLSTHGMSNSTVLFGAWSDQENINKRHNIRRLGYLILCGDEDGLMLNMSDLCAKLEDLCNDLSIKGEVFTCLRAIILKIDSRLLAPVWTLVYSQLQETFESLQESQTIDLKLLLSACKLLDTIIVLAPEDFRL